MGVDAQTIATYDARSEDYRERFRSERPNPHLTAFAALLPDAGHVLDLGCGPGTDALALSQLGFKITGYDASIQMVNLARNIGVDAHLKTFDELDDHAAFDGVWANFSLLHAPRRDMPRHLSAIHRALRPNGTFHLGLKTGEGSRRDGIGRSYTYFAVEELAELLDAAGFTVHKSTTGQSEGLDGTIAPWVVTLCKRDG